jgi:hypothetical protein
MPERGRRHRSYMRPSLACPSDRGDPRRGQPVLDIVYILIGAVFLGGAILYALACEHL